MYTRRVSVSSLSLFLFLFSSPLLFSLRHQTLCKALINRHGVQFLAFECDLVHGRFTASANELHGMLSRDGSPSLLLHPPKKKITNCNFKKCPGGIFPLRLQLILTNKCRNKLRILRHLFIRKKSFATKKIFNYVREDGYTTVESRNLFKALPATREHTTSLVTRGSLSLPGP